MKINHPSVEKLLQLFSAPEKEQDWFDALHTVSFSPDLAKDQSIERIIVDNLKRPIPGVRIQCAEILARLGDPRGILHLTYNVLGVHPVLGEVGQRHQETVSRARMALLRHTDQLTDECIDLLLGDLLSHTGNMHVDVLAGFRDKRVHKALARHLSAPLRASVQASHVLARNGNSDGKSILLQCLKERRYIELSALALSYLADVDAASVLDAVRDGSHDSVKALPRELVDEIVRKVDLRIRLRNSKHTQAKVDEIFRYYAMTIADCIAAYPALKFVTTKQMDLQIILKVPRPMDSLSDILYDLQDSAVCDVLADIQGRSVSQLLKVKGFAEHFEKSGGITSWPSIFNGFPLPYMATRTSGCKIIFDEADYLNAAVDWLVHPARHRQGLVGRNIASYMGEDLY